jgi:hypothetical protein
MRSAERDYLEQDYPEQGSLENVEPYRVTIDPRGALRFIFRDELVDLLDAGQSNITRASLVEPTDDCRWEADLSPVNGPTLGPFRTRGEALAAEVNWLWRHGY